MPQQWQWTLDEIKSKAKALVVENNRLQAQYRKLREQAQKLQQSVDDQQYKNAQMGRFLKQRHGRSDQQARIEELTQLIKTKNRQAKAYEEQWENLKKEQSRLDRKIQSLKDTISSLELRQ